MATNGHSTKPLSTSKGTDVGSVVFDPNLTKADVLVLENLAADIRDQETSEQGPRQCYDRTTCVDESSRSETQADGKGSTSLDITPLITKTSTINPLVDLFTDISQNVAG